MEQWFDSHVHLDRYSRPEREAILARAELAGVTVMSVGVDLNSSREAVALAQTEPLVRGAVVGIHPRYVEGWAQDEVEKLATEPCVRAIGEAGFDAAAGHWARQQEVFEAQAELAKALKLALVVHIDGTGAWEQFVACARPDWPVIVRHYFTGDAEQARWHADRGHYVSFGNPLRRTAELREIARNYPEKLLLIETDSYPLPGRNTEPADVAKVGETLALVRDWTFVEAREHLAANAREVFGPVNQNEAYLGKVSVMP